MILFLENGKEMFVSVEKKMQSSLKLEVNVHLNVVFIFLILSFFEMETARRTTE